MPLFLSDNNKASQLHKKNFSSEKELQAFVEHNLEELFHIKFLASEYVTSQQHGGRVDTLGLDENGSPVIIEYKWGENNAIINQGLFYLDWLVDHQGDFQLLVQQKLGAGIEVDFGSPRLILVASSFSKYDTYAINRMAENIELWSYSLYEKDVFELRLVAESQASSKRDKSQISKTNYEEYSVEQHLEGKNEQIKEAFAALREEILALETDTPISEQPRKYYIAYRTTHNFVSVQIQKSQIKVFVSIDTKDAPEIELKVRDVSKVGHYGTGDTQVIIDSEEQITELMKLVNEAYMRSI